VAVAWEVEGGDGVAGGQGVDIGVPDDGGFAEAV